MFLQYINIVPRAFPPFYTGSGNNVIVNSDKSSLDLFHNPELNIFANMNKARYNTVYILPSLLALFFNVWHGCW